VLRVDTECNRFPNDRKELGSVKQVEAFQLFQTWGLRSLQFEARGDVGIRDEPDDRDDRRHSGDPRFQNDDSNDLVRQI